MANELISLLLDNVEFYQTSTAADCLPFKTLLRTVEKIDPIIQNIEEFAGNYDLDETTQGNGYWSFLLIVQSATQQTEKICKFVKANRGKFFFRKSFYKKEIAAYNELLQSLSVIGSCLVENHNKSDGTGLFSEEGIRENAVRKAMDVINLEVFYGRFLGFNLPRSLRWYTRSLAVFLAMYSEFYYSNDHQVLKLFRTPYNFVKYFLNNKLLSHRIVDIFENASIHLNKSAFKLCESGVYKVFQDLTEHKVSVNQVFHIRPESFKISSENEETSIEIPVPQSHIDVKPVSCRLISSHRRKGMIGLGPGCDALEKSKYLVFHVHGGGWSTQTSKFHGVYLREWAVKLDVPIISVDYSHSPEAPFPRALEEVVFAYSWALKYFTILGTTGENIVLVGDSAGANLITALMVKCIEMGLRKPNGLLNIYGSFVVDYAMAPSRFIGAMDIVLSYSTFMKLAESYNGYPKEKQTAVTENGNIPKSSIVEGDVILKDYHMSPLWAPDEVLSEFPPTYILSTHLDPCLDESVELAKKLKRLEVEVDLEILDKLIHGFLQFSQVSKESHHGSMVCVRRMKELLRMN